MKSFVLNKPHSFEVIEITSPEIKNSGDVLIKIKSVGVCGSDIHYYSDGKIGDQIVAYPFCIGHECAGIVEHVGDDVKNVIPGDRIAIDPLVPCGKCTQGLSGRFHTCLNQKFLGCPGQLEGALAEYLILPSQCCYKIPDHISYQQAVLAEPLSIALHALSFISDYEKSLAILGTGPVGLSVLTAAKFKEIDKIFTTDVLDYRNKNAIENGAVYSGNPKKQNIVKDILEIENEGVDVVFDCCGKQEAIDQAIDILKPGGKLIIIGIPETNEIKFNPHLIRRKEIQIQNVRRQNEKVETALQMLANPNFNIDFMITHNFSFEQTAEAFDLVENYSDGVIKAMINLE